MNSAEATAYGKSPWVIGISLAESDFVWGFGAGSKADFATVGGGENSPHIGWVVLITNSEQASNARWGATYADTKVYAKYALRDFLARRYGTIAALNAAWRSNYTTFDSAGGWGKGTGWLDEDGRNSWIPRDGDLLASATPAMRTDLDDFLFEYASKWFRTQRDALKAVFPDKLYLGPNVVGSWGTPPRKQVLQAAGLYVDVLMTQIGTGASDDQMRLDFTMRYLGDKPIATWLGFPANPDSALGPPNPNTFLATTTQALRGQEYAHMISFFFNARASSSVPGVADVHPYVGVRWWAYADSVGEHTNWGLVSPSDNAYDGKEAVVAEGKDRWGYKIGGEAENYGDFLSAVKSAHRELLNSLQLHLERQAMSHNEARCLIPAFRSMRGQTTSDHSHIHPCCFRMEENTLVNSLSTRQ
jgi:hypothetical protein